MKEDIRKKMRGRRSITQQKMAFAGYLQVFGDRHGDPALSTDERVLLGRVFTEYTDAVELDIAAATQHIEAVLHESDEAARKFAVRRVKQLDDKSAEACEDIAFSEGMISVGGGYTLADRILMLQAVYAAFRMSLQLE